MKRASRVRKKSISRSLYQAMEQHIWFEEGACYLSLGNWDAAEAHLFAVIKADVARQHTPGTTVEELRCYSTSAVAGARDLLLWVQAVASHCEPCTSMVWTIYF